MNFENFSLHPSLLKALQKMEFKTPTPIQEQVIPSMIQRFQDAVALAQTGTGKTAAFGLPLLHHLASHPSIGHTRVLILSPTRELCLQINRELENLSSELNQISIEPVYGGASIEKQLSALRKKPEIICATPGRLIDLFERKAVDLSHLEVLVLDEADEMLNMGFRDDIEKIIQFSSKQKNIWMFSATMPKDVEHLVERYLKNPLRMQAGNVNVTASAIEHHAYVVAPRDKFPTLKRILDYYPDSYGIIFCRTKTDTQKLSDELVHEGYSADALHGDLTQSQREWVMKRFRMRAVQMLVATDVAARGIDVNDLTHVIHYQLPDQPEVYTHRSGRTARAGKSGISVAILSSRESGKWSEIQRVCKFKSLSKKVPGTNEILQKQAEFYLNKLLSAPSDNSFSSLITEDMKLRLVEISKEQILNNYLESALKKIKKYYESRPEAIKEDKNSYTDKSRTLFRLNLGKWDGLDFQSLKENLASWTRQKENCFFVTELKNSFSYVEASPAAIEDMMKINRQNISFNGRTVRVEKREMHEFKFSDKPRSFKKTDRFSKKSSSKLFAKER